MRNVHFGCKRQKLRKIVSILCGTCVSLLLAFLQLVALTYVIHIIKTDKELEMLKTNGYYNPVSVGDYSLNVAIFGNKEGRHTIVSLSGFGKGDCSITERRMVSCLEEDNRVAFVDRAGYGLSDDTTNDMTIDYIVEDYRKALKNAGLKEPYILMPSSIGGAYATYWTSKYPNEIEAVVFLDGTQLSENMRVNTDNAGYEDSMNVFLSQLGFGRYSLRDRYQLYAEGFTEEEQIYGDALNLMTMDSYAMVSEASLRDENLEEAWNNINTNDIPKIYICASWGYQTIEEVTEHGKWVNNRIMKNNLDIPLKPEEYEGNEEYIDSFLAACDEAVSSRLYPYIERLGNCRLVMLGGDHTIYEHQPEQCGLIIKEYISELE